MRSNLKTSLLGLVPSKPILEQLQELAALGGPIPQPVPVEPPTETRPTVERANAAEHPHLEVITDRASEKLVEKLYEMYFGDDRRRKPAFLMSVDQILQDLGAEPLEVEGEEGDEGDEGEQEPAPRREGERRMELRQPAKGEIPGQGDDEEDGGEEETASTPSTIIPARLVITSAGTVRARPA